MPRPRLCPLGCLDFEKREATLAVTEHLPRARHFHEIVTRTAGKATIIPILGMKKLRLREHSHVTKDTRLPCVRPSLCHQICQSPTSHFFQRTEHRALHSVLSSSPPATASRGPEVTGVGSRGAAASQLQPPLPRWDPKAFTSVSGNYKHVSPSLRDTRGMQRGSFVCRQISKPQMPVGFLVGRSARQLKPKKEPFPACSLLQVPVERRGHE